MHASRVGGIGSVCVLWNRSDDGSPPLGGFGGSRGCFQVERVVKRRMDAVAVGVGVVGDAVVASRAAFRGSAERTGDIVERRIEGPGGGG